MFGYSPFTRDQRIGTTLTLVGMVVVFITDRHLLYWQWKTYIGPAVGLLLCGAGAYFNQRWRWHRE